MKILILSAFEDEINVLQQKLKLTSDEIEGCHYRYGDFKSNHIFIAKSGIGTTRAAVNTAILSRTLKPELMFYIGTAGGLLSEQQTGDILIANSIIDIDLIRLPDILKNTPYESCLN